VRPLDRDDARLLATARAEPAAFAVFYDRYEAAVAGYLARRVADPEVVADLTAEVFAAALHAASRYRAVEATAAGWLLTIAHNTVAKSLRRGRVEASQLARWSFGEGSLPDELAAPVWARYGLFRGHPRITGMVLWDVKSREVLSSGTRGEKPFTEVLVPRPHVRASFPWSDDTSRDTSVAAASSPPPDPARVCERCGAAIAAEARPEARYCSKLCRQVTSRARLRERSGRAGLRAPEHCAHCAGPMAVGLRPEALYCSKRCRQAASRVRLANEV
jgi:predicted nucleic acid-binding Zn ribbon protein